MLGMIGLTVASMFLSKPIPEGGLALLASVASGLIGYEAGQKERGNNE